MRNTLAGLAALLILFSTLGWARGWYTVGAQPADPGKFAFRLEVDGPKVGTDVMDGLRFLHSKVSAPKEEKEAKK